MRFITSTVNLALVESKSPFRLEGVYDYFPDYNAFVSFIDKLLAFSREENSVLYKLKLSIQKDKNDQSCVTRWIDSVATPKLKHLDVECVLANRIFLEAIPQGLYTEYDTLVYLRLHRVSMGEFESVSLPCLMTMRLEHNVYAGDASLEIFISSCPVLEDLTIVRMVPDNVKVLRVRSQSLTSLHVDRLFGEGDDVVDDLEREGSGVLIDAPRLKYLKFDDDLTDSKIITNPVSLEKVNIALVFGEHDFTDVDLSKRNMVRSFFNSISGVKEIKISSHTMEDYYHPSREEEAADVRLASIPPCLLSSLESVTIKRFNRGPVNMELFRRSSSCQVLLC
ncbi:hypothetical protein Bca52824_022706 [Brassica carinata]|uniref:F-box/LRR-repeat protein 15/At3g58940/PEG3-like LRR domain-containing protein n=1 Tax=Brassica carinata TaxID=52824 RepID=A0A8X7VH83_BRACI|nr:hypothetical protein Bca52824_022706 [Brassica carinata]